MTKKLRRKRQYYSMTPILRALSLEGFCEHDALQIRKWNAAQVKRDNRRMEEAEKLQVELSRVMKNLSRADRLIVGKFFAMREAIAFKAGITAGIGVRLTEDSIVED